MTTNEMIPICLIRTNGGTQSRSGLNMLVVAEYADAMRRGDQFPPIEVFYDGKVYWLTDGFHRLAAHADIHKQPLNSIKEPVSCVIHQGTQRLAIFRSLSVNANHGLQRSRDDVNRAIRVMLTDDDWGSLTDNAIAKHVGCDPKTVASRRAELVAAGEIEDSGIRKDANGRMMDTRKIGDGPQELPTSSMLDANPSMHPSMPADDELATIGPAPTANPAPKAIPSIVNFQPAPTRTNSQAQPNSTSIMLAAAIKAASEPSAAVPAPAPAAPPLPALTPVAPAAPAPLLTLTPIPSVAAANDPRQALLLAEATAALIEAMNVEAQRLAHIALAAYQDANPDFIDLGVDKSKFVEAAKLAVHAPGIKNQATFLLGAITIVEE